METIYNEILERFTSKDLGEVREWMKKPFSLDDNKSCSTNAYSLVIVPLKTDYDNLSEKVSNIVPKPNTSKILKLDELKIGLSKIPLEDCFDNEFGKCDACNGNGDVDFEFYHNKKRYTEEITCPVCDGDCEIEQTSKTPNGQKKHSLNRYVRIGLCSFNAYRISEMIFLLEKLQVNELEIVYMEQANRPILIKSNDIQFLTCPSMCEDEEIVYNISI
jgi:hypothetical protein